MATLYDLLKERARLSRKVRNTRRNKPQNDTEIKELLQKLGEVDCHINEIVLGIHANEGGIKE